MTLLQQSTGAESPSAAARGRLLSRRREPLFLADWDRVLMIHYEVPPDELQKVVPFELDCWDGRAFVTLVAFTLCRMRPRIGGKLAELLFRPISTHEFLNIRTYARHQHEPGIFFLAEWLSNRLSVALGPRIFGLPYRFGHLRYEHPHPDGQFAGRVIDDLGAALQYTAAPVSLTPAIPSLVTRHSSPLLPCESGSLEEWLMERYTAFTAVPGQPRRLFRVWHKPWPQLPMQIQVKDQTLLEKNWPFFRNAEVTGGNFSPGLKDVWMGWPHRL
jgi:uncharacterized protein YqjF (DUF2071 family)